MAEFTTPDDQTYEKYQDEQQDAWEAACLSCGACCGVQDDPCEDLVISENGKTYCSVYENRFGMHRTKSGKSFRCVPIRNILNKSYPGKEKCAYHVKNFSH